MSRLLYIIEEVMLYTTTDIQLILVEINFTKKQHERFETLSLLILYSLFIPKSMAIRQAIVKSLEET